MNNYALVDDWNWPQDAIAETSRTLDLFKYQLATGEVAQYHQSVISSLEAILACLVQL